MEPRRLEDEDDGSETPIVTENSACRTCYDQSIRQGFDLATMRRVSHFAMSANYSLSWATGTGSISNSQRMIAWQSKEPPKMATPLAFDQRHKFSMNFDYRLNQGEGPMWGKTHWLENTGINLLVNAGSGTPYTPTKVYNAVSLAAQFPSRPGRSTPGTGRGR